MKNIKYLIATITVFLIGVINAFAAPSASISVGSTTIENGSSVKATVKLTGAAAWDVKINCTGATSGNSTHSADAASDGRDGTRTFTLTCKSTSTGIINFVASGDMTSQDGTNKSISLSKSVTVTTPREKSSNSYLSSLSVDGYEISPAFDKTVNQYTVSIPADIKEVTINAKKEDRYASLSGTGTFAVAEGTNSFDITVTSETGIANVYKLIVEVIDQNPIVVTVNNKNYTVVKQRDFLSAPANYEETTVEIDGFEIPGYYSAITKYTLVGLKDENGNISYFIYDANKGSYQKYIEINSKVVTIFPIEATDIPNGYTKTTITINDEKVIAYTNSNSKNFYLIYGINIATGEKGFYRYDSKEGTLQRFTITEIETINNNNIFLYLSVCLGLTSLLLLILLIIVGNKSKKKSKIIAKYSQIANKKKEESEDKNTIKEKKKK